MPNLTPSKARIRKYFSTEQGKIYLGDSLDMFSKHIKPESVDLVMTSPPFGLVRKKEYGNVPADEYLDWFRPFAEAVHRSLKETGSFVIDIGGAWNAGMPTRHLYHYELLIMLCREYGFHLAQDFFWWSPSKLPTPAEWVTVRRIRVKDAINCIWWLSKTPFPKASNRRVLAPYSDSMKGLLKNGYKAKLRPSGHDISDKFSINNGAAIPPNLLALPNTESNSSYLRYCTENDIKAHPARFPVTLPQFFIRMLTDPGDTVVDPFGGSCVTGEAAESLNRKWHCCELIEEYLKGAVHRFDKSTRDSGDDEKNLFGAKTKHGEPTTYKIFHPAAIWHELEDVPLPADGGKKRATKKKQ